MIFIFIWTKESLRQVQWWTKSSLSKQISVISGFDHAFVNSSKFPENEEPSLNSTYDNATMDIPWIPLKCCSVIPWGPTNNQQTHVSDGHGLSANGRRRRKNPPTRRGSGLHLCQCGGKPPLLGLLHHLVNPLSNLHLVFHGQVYGDRGGGPNKRGGGKDNNQEQMFSVKKLLTERVSSLQGVVVILIVLQGFTVNSIILWSCSLNLPQSTTQLDRFSPNLLFQAGL